MLIISDAVEKRQGRLHYCQIFLTTIGRKIAFLFGDDDDDKEIGK